MLMLNHVISLHIYKIIIVSFNQTVVLILCKIFLLSETYHIELLFFVHRFKLMSACWMTSIDQRPSMTSLLQPLVEFYGQLARFI